MRRSGIVLGVVGLGLLIYALLINGRSRSRV